jgi:hypothetical protein
VNTYGVVILIIKGLFFGHHDPYICVVTENEKRNLNQTQISFQFPPKGSTIEDYQNFSAQDGFYTLEDLKSIEEQSNEIFLTDVQIDPLTMWETLSKKESFTAFEVREIVSIFFFVDSFSTLSTLTIELFPNGTNYSWIVELYATHLYLNNRASYFTFNHKDNTFSCKPKEKIEIQDPEFWGWILRFRT